MLPRADTGGSCLAFAMRRALLPKLCSETANRGDGAGGEGLLKNGHPFSKQVLHLVGRIYYHLENAFTGAIRLLTVMVFFALHKASARLPALNPTTSDVFRQSSPARPATLG
jgi:hypothetical protein